MKNRIKRTKVDEKWSDDPSNDDWKRNPDGTFIKDLAGNKIPIDELEELKKKLAELPAKIKDKILSFLSGNTSIKPALAESTKITMTYGQLKRLIRESQVQRFIDLPISYKIGLIQDFWCAQDNGADYEPDIYGFCKYLEDANYLYDMDGYSSEMFKYDWRKAADNQDYLDEFD